MGAKTNRPQKTAVVSFMTVLAGCEGAGAAVPDGAARVNRGQGRRRRAAGTPGLLMILL